MSSNVVSIALMGHALPTTNTDSLSTTGSCVEWVVMSTVCVCVCEGSYLVLVDSSRSPSSLIACASRSASLQ